MPVKVLLIGDSNTMRIRFAPTVPEQRLLAIDGVPFIKVDGLNDTVFSCAGLPGLPGLPRTPTSLDDVNLKSFTHIIVAIGINEAKLKRGDVYLQDKAREILSYGRHLLKILPGVKVFVTETLPSLDSRISRNARILSDCLGEGCGEDIIFISLPEQLKSRCGNLNSLFAKKGEKVALHLNGRGLRCYMKAIRLAVQRS